MAARKRREIPGDDGETVAKMNVEGMPWYVPERKKPSAPDGPEPYRMTKAEQRACTRAAVRAGLTIVLVFGAVFAAFIAFCDFVWFR